MSDDLSKVQANKSYLVLLGDPKVSFQIKHYLLKQAPEELIHTLSVLAFNCCRGSLSLTDEEFEALKDYKEDLYVLADTDNSLSLKRSFIGHKNQHQLLVLLLSPSLRALSSNSIEIPNGE